MFQKLVSHNDDLRRLVEKGYAVAIDSNCLIVRDIPYLDSNLELQIGAIIAKLKFIDRNRFEQQDHQIYFSGAVPYGLDQKPIGNLGGGPCKLELGDVCNDVVVQRSFSNKPKAKGKYDDHFHKVEIYAALISGPAEHLFDKSPLTFRAIENIVEDTIFKFHDTLTSRAGIGDISARLESDVIAIIGLGGTGAYILDYLVKTPVREIRGFDHKKYYVHTAYRSPGRLEEKELGIPKVNVYQSRYDNFRHGLKLEDSYIDRTCVEKLDTVSFAFVSVDNGDARAEIMDLLMELNIPFIDVGMGLKRREDALSGMMRTTYFPAENAKEIRNKNWVSEVEDRENMYKDNIQISELNALNASIAVIRYKQLRGFYCEDESNLNILLNISSLLITRETDAD